MVYAWLFPVLLWTTTNAANIQLLECQPPDRPIWGGYGPVEESYSPGDTIHYFCAVDTFIGGNYFRICQDTGDWSGDTPVCDAPSTFSSTSQSSTEDAFSNSEVAVDGIKETCTATIGGQREEWSGTFVTPGQLIRVMLFLPLGPASFEVILVKANGDEVICGSQTRNIDRYEWTFQNCPEPHNTGAAGLKIKSLSNDPLQICEIRAFVLTSPKCTDPHITVESGHLRLNRKSAVLVCDRGFTRSPDTKLDCIREGQWNKKTLYCSQPAWSPSENRETASNAEKETERFTERRRQPSFRP